ncbi:MAG: hypothetical protein ACR2RE_11455 [Geminicoccaceae bacterium]
MASKLLVLVMLGLMTACASYGAPARATEDRFIYVDRMPAIRGELRRSIEVDHEDGERIAQEVFAEDFEHAVIETYVVTIACGTGQADTSEAGRTYIVAIKYPPKRPKTFAVATLHDIYKDVYVLDQAGRIRLYEDLQAQSMLTLSERFKPACPSI